MDCEPGLTANVTITGLAGAKLPLPLCTAWTVTDPAAEKSSAPLSIAGPEISRKLTGRPDVAVALNFSGVRRPGALDSRR